MTITVYYNPASAPARCIINFLDYAKDTTVVRQVIDLMGKREQMEPWFIAMNPHHTVPTLKDDENDVVLYESTAILQYLAEKLQVTGRYGLPEDTKAKWVTINALHNQHNFISKANMDIMGAFYGAFFTKQPLNVDAMKAGVEAAKAKFTLLEKMLEERGGFIGGAEPTIADVRAWADVFQLSNVGGEASLETMDFSVEFPNIQKWLVAIKADLFDEELWKTSVGFYTAAAAAFGGPVFRLAPKRD